MRQLREGGIYLAQNGQSFVASNLRQTTSDGKRIASALGEELCCFLFSRYQWAFHGAPDYEVTASGNLLPLRQSPGCQIDHLVDTGATAGAH